MIKRILVALDPDADTRIATHYAMDLARRTGAEITGLAVVDTKHIVAETGIGGSIGALHYAEKIRRQMTEKARDIAQDLIDTFVGTLDEAGLPHQELVMDGTPADLIVDALNFHDILFVGRDPHFFYNRPDRPTDTLARVVKRGVAPAVVVGPAFRPIRRVLLACDGSAPSIQTMQRFAQLQPFGTDLTVDLVHIREDTGEAARHRADLLLHRTRTYLEAHGFQTLNETSMEGDHTAERLLRHAEHHEADLIVAGAHSVSAVRRIAFGSTTHALLDQSTIPLFLYH